MAGATTALFAYDTDAGAIGAVLVGMIVGVVTLVGGQIAVAAVHSSLIRVAIALFFAVPAAIAGYNATRGLLHISVPAEGWRDALVLIGAIIVGSAAWTRMTPVAPTRGGQVVPPSPQLLRRRRTETGENLAAFVTFDSSVELRGVAECDRGRLRFSR